MSIWFQGFVEKHGFSKIIYCFLMRTEEKVILDMGTALMPMPDALGLEKTKFDICQQR